MDKFKLTDEYIEETIEQFKKSDDWKEFVVPLIKSLGTK